jgi:hypothetical protein
LPRECRCRRIDWVRRVSPNGRYLRAPQLALKQTKTSCSSGALAGHPSRTDSRRWRYKQWRCRRVCPRFC